MKKLLALAIIIAAMFTGTQANAGKTCKQMRSCAEAVESWCGGWSDRDRDNDGIPCENICKSRSQTKREESKIGCTL